MKAKMDPVLQARTPFDLERNLHLFYSEALLKYKQNGYVVLKGFCHNKEEFTVFSNQLFSRLSTYQNGFFSNRETINNDKTLMTATVSKQDFAVPFHSEMYYRAEPPEMLCFYALNSPNEGGETRLFDGYSFFEQLSEELQTRFIESRIRYRSVYNLEEIKSTFNIINKAELDAFCRNNDYSWDSEANFRSIYIDYFTSALRTSDGGHSYRFVNNIIALLLGEEKHRRNKLNTNIPLSAGNVFPITVRFENGKLITRQILSELISVSSKVAIEHSWANNDILLVDNSRMQHARNKCTDEHRKILVRMGAPKWKTS